MRGRTHLTTPPGEEPLDDVAATGTTERYVPAFDLPDEPRVPGRHRRRLVVAVVLLVLAIAGWIIYRLATAGQFQDPALSDLLPGDTPTEQRETVTPTEG